MTTYEIHPGDTLTMSVNGGVWQVATFARRDFADMAQATPAELAKVIERLDGVATRTDEEDHLVIGTAAVGSISSLEVDLARSTAAAGLGLTATAAQATGSGLRAAQLVSAKDEPFRLPDKSRMTVLVDGRKRSIKFEGAITPRAAKAVEVASAINARARGVAQAGRDGHVMLTSPTLGAESALEVLPGDTDGGWADAAAILGFTGADAISRPYPSTPAELDCAGLRPQLRIENLTAGPIELSLPEGSVVVPARGGLALPPGAAGDPAVQQFIRSGAIRLSLEPAP